jgi:hypothetical protein
MLLSAKCGYVRDVAVGLGSLIERRLVGAGVRLVGAGVGLRGVGVGLRGVGVQ